MLCWEALTTTNTFSRPSDLNFSRSANTASMSSVAIFGWSGRPDTCLTSLKDFLAVESRVKVGLPTAGRWLNLRTISMHSSVWGLGVLRSSLGRPNASLMYCCINRRFVYDERTSASRGINVLNNWSYRYPYFHSQVNAFPVFLARDSCTPLIGLARGLVVWPVFFLTTGILWKMSVERATTHRKHTQ